MVSVKIVQGMKARTNKFVEYTDIDVVVDKLKKGTNNYELLTEEYNRVYLDIDAKVDPNITEEEFNRRDNELLERIKQNSHGYKVAIATASSFDFKKISYHVHYPEYYTTKEGNKRYAIQQNELYKDLKDVKIDTSVYGSTSQKFRCVFSTKENENRPFKMVVGEVVDTIIQYMPEGCTEMNIPDPKEEKTKKKEQVKKQKLAIQQTEDEMKELREREKDLIMLLNILTPERLADYDSWLRVGFVIFNAGLPVEDWDKLSKRASNYEAGVCHQKWATFDSERDHLVGKTTILEMIKEDTPEKYVKYYPVMKELFELTHFKVMNPFQFVRIPPPEEKRAYLQMNAELFGQYKNRYTLEGDRFIDRWTNDENIRTYEELTFHPKKELCPKDSFNTYEGFAVEKLTITEEVSLDRIFKQMRILTGNEEENFQWFIKYLAHIFQKPEKKTQIGLIMNGGQGTGKDTFWDFIGSLLGDKLYYTTSRPDEDVYGKFNFATACRILIRIQEMSRDSFKRNATKVKSCISDPTLNYEEKGMKKMTLPSYENHVYTTNDDTPIYLEADDRRMVIFTPSTEYAQNREYFEPLLKDYTNPSVKRAFYEYLMKVDLKDWVPNNRDVVTSTYKDVQIQSAPPLAKFFNEILLDSGDMEYRTTAEMLMSSVNEKFRTNYSRHTIGHHLRNFIKEGALVKTRSGSRTHTVYEMDNQKMEQYLKSRSWWFEDP